MTTTLVRLFHQLKIWEAVFYTSAMPSDKAVQILRVRSGLSQQEIFELSEAEAWRRIYALDKTEKTLRSASVEICFTGFSVSDRVALETEALAKGLVVKTTVTKSLRYLCAGPSAGPLKLAKARIQGVQIVDSAEFRHVVL